MKKLEIPFEFADEITKANLIDARNTIKSDLEKWNASPRSDELINFYMHPDDLIYNERLFRALDVVIDYFGGDL
ncbi:MAG: hypothetical protein EBU33_07660 [Sphingobacteriia bacterium]|nr:hypothetical protein [Sphingobacteriia bacterium]